MIGLNERDTIDKETYFTIYEWKIKWRMNE